MIYIQTRSTDPAYNLAAEEYAQKELTCFPKIFMLWQNDNAIIVGRYQNMAKEINIDAARELGVRVVRRSTGGGTVYHDLGNLNYSFISECASPELMDRNELCSQIVSALNAMGINVIASGRNDILLDGRKISGTAQSLSRGRLLHHGTLLFDSDMNVLAKVLNVDQKKLQSKSISSVKSRVTNIKDALSLDYDMDTFRKRLLENLGPYEEYVFTDEDIAKIKKIRDAKYGSEEWNIGAEPSFSFSSEKRYSGGTLNLKFNVKAGTIEAIRIYGDFLGVSDITELEEMLAGCRFTPESVNGVLRGTDLFLYLGGISAEDFADCMFSETVM